jgi:hypothetical protein
MNAFEARLPVGGGPPIPVEKIGHNLARNSAATFLEGPVFP